MAAGSSVNHHRRPPVPRAGAANATTHPPPPPLAWAWPRWLGRALTDHLAGRIDSTAPTAGLGAGRPRTIGQHQRAPPSRLFVLTERHCCHPRPRPCPAAGPGPESRRPPAGSAAEYTAGPRDEHVAPASAAAAIETRGRRCLRRPRRISVKYPIGRAVGQPDLGQAPQPERGTESVPSNGSHEHV